MYFPFSELHRWGERFAAQPQTIFSEVPKGEKNGKRNHYDPATISVISWVMAA